MCLINGNLIAPKAEFITYISIIYKFIPTGYCPVCKSSRLEIITHTADRLVRDPDIAVTALSYHRIKLLNKNYSIKAVLSLM